MYQLRSVTKAVTKFYPPTMSLYCKTRRSTKHNSLSVIKMCRRVFVDRICIQLLTDCAYKCYDILRTRSTTQDYTNILRTKVYICHHYHYIAKICPHKTLCSLFLVNYVVVDLLIQSAIVTDSLNEEMATKSCFSTLFINLRYNNLLFNSDLIFLM